MEAGRTWKIIPGRCGACTKFVRDFGDADKAYGHCPIKKRSGSLSTKDAKCAGYSAVPEALAKQRDDTSPRFDPWDTHLDRHEHKAREVRRRASQPNREAAEKTRQRQRREQDHQPIEEFNMERHELRKIIEEAIDDALQLKAVDMLERFVGGRVVIEPGREGSQAKEIPIDVLFKKIVSLRDNLRVLEQKVNTHEKLENADRVQLQQYITRCYGSLTTFNALFQNKDDGFKGAGS